MNYNYYTGKNGKDYFNFRSKRKDHVAQSESSKIFKPFIKQDAAVLDFGCGTGGILRNINCARKLGIEINEPSIEIAKSYGIKVFRYLNDVPDAIADVIITHHALEHVEDPLLVLKNLFRKLKPGGNIIVVVPAEKLTRTKNKTWEKYDRDKHLYSWNPMTLGNLMTIAGFEIEDSYISEAGYSHYIEWSRSIPLLFNYLIKIIAFLASRYNTVCVARKTLNTDVYD